jgi:hypothetical protein
MAAEYWTLVEPIWERISIDMPERFLREFNAAPAKSRTLFAAHWAQSEIMNGGLGQFFSNPTGVLAPEAVDAFRMLGMTRCAMILSEAMAFFGNPYPRDRRIREEAFERFFEEQGEGAIPFREQEDAMAIAIEDENGGFWEAANRFATDG